MFDSAPKCEQTSSILKNSFASGVLATAFFTPFGDTHGMAEAALPPTVRSSVQQSEVDYEKLTLRAAQYFIDARTENGLIRDRTCNRFSADEVQQDTPNIASIAASGYGLAALPIMVENQLISRAQARLWLSQSLTTVAAISKDTPGHWLHHFVDGQSGVPRLNSEVSTVDTALYYYGAIAAGEYLGGSEKERVYTMLSKLDFELMRTNAGTRPESLSFCHGYYMHPETEEVRFIENRWDSVSEGILVPFLAIGAGAAPGECWTVGISRNENWVGRSQKTFDNLPLFTFFYPLGYLPIRGSEDALGTNYWQEAADAVDLQQEFSITQKLPAAMFGYSASDGPGGYYAFEAEDHGNGIVLAPPAVVASLPFARQDVDALLPHLQEANLFTGTYGIVAAYEPATGWQAKDMIGIDIGSMLLMLDAHTDQTVWNLMRQSPVIQRGLKDCGFVERKNESMPIQLNNDSSFSTFSDIARPD